MQLLSALFITLLASGSAVSAHSGHGRFHRRGPYGNSSDDSAFSSVAMKPVDLASSSIASSATTQVAIPMTTGTSDSVSAAAAQDPNVVTKITNSTLTYTLGSGSSTTVVTTTVQHTQTTTVLQTVYAKKPSASDAGVSAAAASTVAEPTTTISQTLTSTKYVTVLPSPSRASAGDVQAAATGAAGSISSGSSSSGSGSNAGSDSEASCAAPVTVTVTAQSTVTVTATPTINADPTSRVAIVTPSAAPYGWGNGTDTNIAAASGVAKPSGFVQRRRY